MTGAPSPNPIETSIKSLSTEKVKGQDNVERLLTDSNIDLAALQTSIEGVESNPVMAAKIRAIKALIEALGETGTESEAAVLQAIQDVAGPNAAWLTEVIGLKASFGSVDDDDLLDEDERLQSEESEQIPANKQAIVAKVEELRGKLKKAIKESKLSDSVKTDALVNAEVDPFINEILDDVRTRDALPPFKEIQDGLVRIVLNLMENESVDIASGNVLGVLKSWAPDALKEPMVRNAVNKSTASLETSYNAARESLMKGGETSEGMESRRKGLKAENPAELAQNKRNVEAELLASVDKMDSDGLQKEYMEYVATELRSSNGKVPDNYKDWKGKQKFTPMEKVKNFLGMIANMFSSMFSGFDFSWDAIKKGEFMKKGEEKPRTDVEKRLATLEKMTTSVASWKGKASVEFNSWTNLNKDVLRFVGSDEEANKSEISFEEFGEIEGDNNVKTVLGWARDKDGAQPISKRTWEKLLAADITSVETKGLMDERLEFTLVEDGKAITRNLESWGDKAVLDCLGEEELADSAEEKAQLQYEAMGSKAVFRALANASKSFKNLTYLASESEVEAIFQKAAKANGVPVDLVKNQFLDTPTKFLKARYLAFIGFPLMIMTNDNLSGVEKVKSSAEFGLSLVPVFGNFVDIIRAARGKDINNRNLSTSEQWTALGFGIGGLVLDFTGVGYLARLAAKTGYAGAKVKKLHKAASFLSDSSEIITKKALKNGKIFVDADKKDLFKLLKRRQQNVNKLEDMSLDDLVDKVPIKKLQDYLSKKKSNLDISELFGKSMTEAMDFNSFERVAGKSAAGLTKATYKSQVQKLSTYWGNASRVKKTMTVTGGVGLSAYAGSSFLGSND